MKLRELLSDRRGGIALMGILMGAVLVAVLFHLTNCGFGILWRENAQDAADATAYEAALWNARGMNVVVAVNIFIALVMAILIFWRMVILFLFGLTVLLAIACPFQPEFCSFVPLTANAARTMIQQDQRVAGRVYQVISMLHDAQKIVAAATPVMGTLSSALEAQKYDAEFGIGFGTQLIPTVGFTLGKKPDKSCSSRAKRWNDKSGSAGDLLGKPVSLPVVEADDLSKLCQQGGKMQFVVLWYVVGKVGEKLGISFLKDLGSQQGGGEFGKAWGSITGHADEFFCGDFMGLVNEVADDAINNKCGDDKDCRDKANKGKNKDPLPDPGKSSSIDSSQVRWTRIWDLAANGNLFMQSWSYVKIERKQMGALDRVLRVADIFGQSKSQGDGTESGASTFAQAEMYFDCSSQWSDATCSELAPWAMRWRARLRRVHDPVDLIASSLESTMVSALYGGLEGHFGGAVASKFAPLTQLLSKNGGRLIQFKTSEHFRSGRNQLVRNLPGTSADGASPARNAASWVSEQAELGASELIH
ncbi:MAG: hypothetical protein ACOY0T_35330 [Myxococcota bacterium]